MDNANMESILFQYILFNGLSALRSEPHPIDIFGVILGEGQVREAIVYG
jgi:hypothetical protein